MTSRMPGGFLICMLFIAALSGCAGLGAQAATPTVVWQEGTPREGQPAFPTLGQYWIIDNGCNFDQQKVTIADQMFEKLRTDGIAEVALICQTGVVNKGATNDEKIWLRDWARWAKMGTVQDSRALVWLIRPDAKPADGRISLEASRWLTFYTAVDYAGDIQEAGNYASAGDFNGALVSIARNTDLKLRQLWSKEQPSPTSTAVQ